MKPSPLRLNLSPTEPRECTSCGKFLAARHFPNPVTLPSGYVSVIRCCKACANARRRKGPGIGNRPPKRNAAGLYHCYHCHQYLPAESFGRNRGRPAPNCRPCSRKLNALARAYASPERRAREREQSRRQQRTKSARVKHARQQQVAFAQDAVRILRRRGLTKAQICLLGGFNETTVTRWERGTRVHCRSDAMNRLIALMRATAFLPNTQEPPYRTQRRHPEWDRIVEELRWEMGEFAI